MLSHHQTVSYHIINVITSSDSTLSHRERLCYHIVRDYVITSSETTLSHRQRLCYHIIRDYVITLSETTLSHHQRVSYHIVREYVITFSETMISHVLSYWWAYQVVTWLEWCVRQKLSLSFVVKKSKIFVQAGLCVLHKH